MNGLRLCPTVCCLAAVVATAALVSLWKSAETPVTPSVPAEAGPLGRTETERPSARPPSGGAAVGAAAGTEGGDAGAGATGEADTVGATEEPETGEPAGPAAGADKRRAVASAAAFDRLTDAWTKKSPARPSSEECVRYAQAYQSLPPAVRHDCLRRALNLVPDRNVGLLSAILLEKKTDAQSKKAVFEDVVNRPEEVKKPIVEEILKDKTHPCYSDAEWIYEVTGEKLSTEEEEKGMTE